jgi:KUP system potassium uptake protein
MASLVVPISLGILIALFAIQSKGSGKIGRSFGPVMLIWFLTLAVLGSLAIVRAPQVLAAVNPWYALTLLETHPLLALTIFGAVFLCVTGGEALYADLGHFGRPAIARAWLFVVWPALLLNYFGQGALVLLDPTAVKNPFYLLAPPVLTIPLVLLAAMATVIASQAVITGVFSIARQCQLLGYLPRMRIVQSSADSIGQVYLPFVNAMLCLSTLLLVLGFGTADNLSGAYGVGISITMVIDTILMLSLLSVAPMRWRRSQIAALAIVLLVELLFVAGNLPKLPSGGWFPLLFGGTLLAIMLTWQTGRKAVARRTAREELTTAQFKALLEKHQPQLVDKTVIFLSSKADLIPRTLVRNIRTNGILHQQTIVMTVQVAAVPRVALGARTRVTEVLPHVFRVVARVGFMDQLDVPVLLREAQRLRKDLNTKHAVYVIGHDAVVTAGSSSLLRLQKLLFAFMSRNEALAGNHFGIAAHSIVESGGQVEI